MPTPPSLGQPPTQRVEPSEKRSLRQIPFSNASPSLILGPGRTAKCVNFIVARHACRSPDRFQEVGRSECYGTYEVGSASSRHHRKRNARSGSCRAPSPPKSETDVEIAPLVQQVRATSIAEIEKIIGELQEAKHFLQSEGERVQRETEHYTTLTQMASASVKIISDTVAKWRETGHPLRNHSTSTQFEVTPFPSEDGT